MVAVLSALREGEGLKVLDISGNVIKSEAAAECVAGAAAQGRGLGSIHIRCTHATLTYA